MEPAFILLLGKPSEWLPLLPLFSFFLLAGVEAGPFALVVEEAKRLTLPPAVLEVEAAKGLTLPPAVADWPANCLAWALSARVAEPTEPTHLPGVEATPSAWRTERLGDVDFAVLPALGVETDFVVLTALGVETGVAPPRRCGGRVERCGRPATESGAEAFVLGEAFVLLVRRGGMLEGVSRGTKCGGTRKERWGAEGWRAERRKAETTAAGRRCDGDCVILIGGRHTVRVWQMPFSTDN